MRRLPTALLLTLAALGVIAAAPRAEAGPCGSGRWEVKILADRDAARVDFRPEETTVSELVALKTPETPHPRDRRIAPEELKTYRVTARFVRLKRQSDKDLHVYVADLADDSKRMIVEIPAPECVAVRADEYRRAREVAQSLGAGALVEVVGVGFWDKNNSERGAARNGFELHPVLLITSDVRPPAQAPPPEEPAGADVKLGPIVGDRRSMIYHWPGCPGYGQVSPADRIHFPTREAAERAGYRAARNCR
jgi:hypothetical protein